MDDTVEQATEAAISFLTVLGYAGLGLLAGLLVSILVTVLVRVVRRRHPALRHTSRRLKIPQRVFLAVLGTGTGVAVGTSMQVLGAEPAWRAAFMHVFLIALIIAAGYLLSAALFALEDTALERFKGAEESGHARRVRTQMQVIRRVGVAIVWIAVVAGILLTFESFRAIGASLFASAGLLSIVAGLAAQSSLSNMFAGIQIAFTDALRVGDVVVVGGQFGNVEEVTLTYVVLRLWDDRRMVLPSTHFTTQPFENWTRREAHLLGTVELDLDFLTPVPALRVEAQRIAESSELWDGRTLGLQVTDAVGGYLRVRVVASARNSGQLFDLRCLIREGLVDWLTTHAPYALPRQRFEPEVTTAPPPEERRQFVEEIQEAWDAERSQEPDVAETLLGEPVEESDTQRLQREAEARRARREAEKADRRAARGHPARLAVQEVRPLPSDETTRVLSESELAALEGDAATTPADAAASTPAEADGGPAATPPRTSILHRAEGQRAAESRLFSGSPEAEERANRLSGPSAVDMAEREDTARRRVDAPRTQPTPEPTDPTRRTQ
ncbi:MAG: mechanosensitive ion channel [Actinomycetales bacterium]|nr:mechanosensitive ion channel [Actinomycetales bacterium]